MTRCRAASRERRRLLLIPEGCVAAVVVDSVCACSLCRHTHTRSELPFIKRYQVWPDTTKGWPRSLTQLSGGVGDYVLVRIDTEIEGGELMGHRRSPRSGLRAWPCTTAARSHPCEYRCVHLSISRARERLYAAAEGELTACEEIDISTNDGTHRGQVAGGSVQAAY